MEEKKFNALISKLAQKYDFTYEIEKVKFGFIRAAIECSDIDQYYNLQKAVERIKGVKVTTWASFYGAFEGRVYLMEENDAKQLKKLLDEECNRVEDWWQRYHAADGKTRELMACGKIK